MKKYIFLLFLIPMVILASPKLDTIAKTKPYPIVYPDFTQSIIITDFYSPPNQSSTASGYISIKNNVLSISFSNTWSARKIKTGVIKVLNVSPALPDIELGPVLSDSGENNTGHFAKIQNNSLIIYTQFNFNFIAVAASPNLKTGLVGTIPNYSLSLGNVFTCSTGSGASITISSTQRDATIYLGTENPSTPYSSCRIKTGVIARLAAPIINNDLGPLKDNNGLPTGYGAKIENQDLIFYEITPVPELSTGILLNYNYDLSDRDYPSDNNNHWIHNISYDSKGNISRQSRSYFNEFGKSDVSLSKDYVSGKIWGTETIFDYFGRPDKTSFIAPSPLSNFDKTNFLKSNSQAQTESPAIVLPLNNISSSNNYKATQSISATGTVSSGLNITLTAPIVTLGNTFTVSATSGSSFVVTAANLSDASANASLANYYSDSNTDEPYQATATHPFAQNNYDILNPENVINVVGGNKINGEWKTGYSYSVPAAQEMHYVYGSDYFDGYSFSGKEIVDTKFNKTIIIDANGNENVAFTDGEGKLLATARSGGVVSYPVISVIGTQGFVDVHIPSGIPSSQISLIQDNSLYKAYDLKTGQEITPITSTSFVGGNAYRIVAITPPIKDYDTYVILFDGRVANENGALGISYNVNYYDYTVNVYNKTGQLIKTIQPNGYTNNATIVPSPTHMTSTNFATTYKYNTFGQIIELTSPDKGLNKYVYRNDGQIRYSQNALQADTKVSYTDYDILGRPIESGVITGSNGIWATVSANPDAPSIVGTRSEQLFIVYDYPENNATSVVLPTTPSNLTLAGVLATAGISSTNYTQNNLSGNIAITYTKPGASISAITWYSYDLYGRAEWIVQYNEGLDAKTIHYEYDNNGNVKKVLFQKDKASELFVHKNTYNTNNTLTNVETSTDNTNFVSQADYSYYKTGELKRINIAQGLQGIDYVYTLSGQLKSINHPSLEASKDPGGDKNDVFGLTLDYYNGDYLRTGRNITSSPNSGADYNGNIKATRWTNKGVPGDYSGNIANPKGYLYNYNRNNWLTGAVFGNINSSTGAITPSAVLTEGNLTYDSNGNIKTLQRTNEAGTVVDNLTYKYTNTGNNQLNNITENAAVTSSDPNDIENQVAGNYIYDAIGQLKQNVSENLYYFYNALGLVTEVKKGSNTLVKFFYNERRQRIKKESYNTMSPFNLQTTTFYQLDLSGNTLAVYNLPNTGTISQIELPIYGLNRLGIYKRNGITSFEIKDHLGNIRAVIEKENGNPQVKSFADYYPFGELLPNRNSLNYRYAFQGQEKDMETQMEAFQLRLWDGRIGRWISTDPMEQHNSPYLGMSNNPVNRIDPNGGFDIPEENGFYYGQKHVDEDGSWMWNGIMWEGLNGTYDMLAEVVVSASGFYKNFLQPDISSHAFKWNALNTGYNGENFKHNIKVVNFEAENYNVGFERGGKISVAGVKAKGALNIGYDDFFNYNLTGEGSVFSASAETRYGVMAGNNGKWGFSSGQTAAASVLEGSIQTKVTVLGFVLKSKMGGALVSASTGYLNSAYYDEFTGAAVIDIERRAAWGIGGRAAIHLEIPVLKIANFFNDQLN